jgi:hypothetical protein
MGDVTAGIQDGFVKRLGTLLERHAELIESLSYEEGIALGERAADAALAPVVWNAAVGERWPTNTVTEFLHVTRQALHKRVVAGTALGLAGKGTTWFPVWQFDLESHQLRPVVADIVRAFREELGSVDPYLIASWATTPQRELQMSPEVWIALANDNQQLLKVAKRAARAVAR